MNKDQADKLIEKGKKVSDELSLLMDKLLPWADMKEKLFRAFKRDLYPYQDLVKRLPREWEEACSPVHNDLLRVFDYVEERSLLLYSRGVFDLYYMFYGFAEFPVSMRGDEKMVLCSHQIKAPDFDPELYTERQGTMRWKC